MNTRQAFNTWAAQYDTNSNKTRDLEGKALEKIYPASTLCIVLKLVAEQQKIPNS